MLMQLIQIGLASLLLVVFMWPRKKDTHHNSCGCEHNKGDKHES